MVDAENEAKDVKVLDMRESLIMDSIEGRKAQSAGG
jgi:hypothetical protein